METGKGKKSERNKERNVGMHDEILRGRKGRKSNTEKDRHEREEK